MKIKDNFKVILCPNTKSIEETMQERKPEATVKVKSMGKTMQGTEITLGSTERGTVPPACRAVVKSLEKGTILISSLDLDTIGGVLAITGDKPKDTEFWKAIAYLDINGTHNLYKLSQDVQDKVNVLLAWQAFQPHMKYDKPTNVTSIIAQGANILKATLDERHPKHDAVIQKGKEWAKINTQAIESQLVDETPTLRTFITNGIPCANAFYSPTQNQVVSATLTLDKETNRITIATLDGNSTFSARDIAKQLWGSRVDGDEILAMSPCNEEMTEEDLEKTKTIFSSLITINEQVKNIRDVVLSLPPESISHEYAHNVFVEELNGLFENLDYEVECHYVLDEEYLEELGREPTSTEALKSIMGIEVNITSDNFSVSAEYIFDEEQTLAFNRACRKVDPSYNREHWQEVNAERRDWYEAPKKGEEEWDRQYWPTDDKQYYDIVVDEYGEVR